MIARKTATLALVALAALAGWMILASLFINSDHSRIVSLQRQVAQLQARPARPVAAVTAAASTPRPCPLAAASCITTPDKSRYGLLLVGSRAAQDLGGDPLMVTDYNHAPEMWMQGGSLYVLARPGWIGGQLCIDVALKVNYCLTYQDIVKLHALG